ncbi:unnamed protein product [Coccothraustes coccothraustes]
MRERVPAAVPDGIATAPPFLPSPGRSQAAPQPPSRSLSPTLLPQRPRWDRRSDTGRCRTGHRPRPRRPLGAGAQVLFVRQFLHPPVTPEFPEETSPTFLAQCLPVLLSLAALMEKACGTALWHDSAFQTRDGEK